MGKIINLKTDKKEYESAIKKYPTQEAYLTKTGFLSDEQADKVHHGGENKAVLLFSTITYNKINIAKNTSLAFDGIAHFGENIAISHSDENSVCVGDLFKIGEAILEVSQPREPCWKLSANTQISDMTKLIYKNGFTGWYARVVKEGLVKQDDEATLLDRKYPNLTIANLNTLIQNPKIDTPLYNEAVECDTLGAAFKKSLTARFLAAKIEEPEWR